MGPGATLLVVAAAGLTGLAGLGVPRLVRALPEHPHDRDDPRPTYAEVAGLPHLGIASAGLGALAGGVLAWAVGAQGWLVGLLGLVPVGVALAVVDARTRLLPRRLVLPATAALAVWALVLWPLAGEGPELVRSVLALVVARSSFWLLWFVRSAGLGFGDVRLAALLGLALGHLGWAEVVVGLYAGLVVFGVPGLVLALARRDRAALRRPSAFGPALLVGALLGIVLGGPVARGLGWG